MLQAAGVVLAGGKSSRMGTDKALLLLENQTLLERSVEKLRKSFADVILVSNGKVKYDLPGVNEITDIYPDRGPIGGIYTALKNTGHDRIFVAACDLPFWEKELAELLMEASKGYDAAIPCIGCYFEPLLAVYTKKCLAAIEDCFGTNNYKVSDLYPKLKVNYVKRDMLCRVCLPEKAFCNINTYEEYSKMKAQYEESPEYLRTRIG